jgi:hypothetical protein
MIHILHNLPNAKKSTLELLENDLENKVTSLDQSDYEPSLEGLGRPDP